jgi:hypothetical protein
MGLRKATYLIRTLLVLISFQFTAPVVFAGQVEKDLTHFSISTQKQSTKSFGLSTLFEKTEKEGEEERTKFSTVELRDIDLTFRVRSVAHQSFQLSTVSEHIQQSPLFRLHCVYLI